MEQSTHAPTSICTVDGCQRPPRTRGYCNRHYLRLIRTGSTDGEDHYRDPEEAFRAHTEWRGDCLIWTGSKYQRGYGAIGIGGKRGYAHRYAWERAHGPIPVGAQVDHICHNRACVNVEHLRLVAPEQNSSNRSGPTSRNRASGVRNVYRNGSGWSVSIRKRGQAHHFGTYSTIEEAAEVADLARHELFGEYAGLGGNTPSNNEQRSHA